MISSSFSSDLICQTLRAWRVWIFIGLTFVANLVIAQQNIDYIDNNNTDSCHDLRKEFDLETKTTNLCLTHLASSSISNTHFFKSLFDIPKNGGFGNIGIQSRLDLFYHTKSNLEIDLSLGAAFGATSSFLDGADIVSRSYPAELSPIGLNLRTSSSYDRDYFFFTLGNQKITRGNGFLIGNGSRYKKSNFSNLSPDIDQSFNNYFSFGQLKNNEAYWEIFYASTEIQEFQNYEVFGSFIEIDELQFLPNNPTANIYAAANAKSFDSISYGLVLFDAFKISSPFGTEATYVDFGGVLENSLEDISSLKARSFFIQVTKESSLQNTEEVVKIDWRIKSRVHYDLGLDKLTNGIPLFSGTDSYNNSNFTESWDGGFFSQLRGNQNLERLVLSVTFQKHLNTRRKRDSNISHSFIFYRTDSFGDEFTGKNNFEYNYSLCSPKKYRYYSNLLCLDIGLEKNNTDSNLVNTLVRLNFELTI